MQAVVWACVTLGVLSVGSVASAANEATFEGTATEIGPSPYANKGGLGRVVIDDKKMRVVFHILKTTTITKMVDGEAQPAKFEDVKKGDTLRATYDGRLMESKPPQAWAIKLVIEKAAD